MKLALLGATGGVGREVLSQALAAGHAVTAVVRNPAKLPAHIDVVRQDLATPDVEVLAATLRDVDAVISTVGASRPAQGGIVAPATAASIPRLARPNATARPGTGTANSPGSWARPWSAPAGPTPFLGARYRRITRRRGKKKAIVAVGRSVLVITWHLLADPDTRFHELGADHYDRHVNTHRKRRNTSASSKLSATASRSNLRPERPGRSQAQRQVHFRTSHPPHRAVSQSRCSNLSAGRT